MYKNILIIGAGISGEIIGRELENSNNINLIGYLDDEQAKEGAVLNNKPIFGPTSLLPEILEEYDIHQVIISIPSAEGKKIKEIIKRILPKDIQIQIVPGFYNILEQDIKIDYPIRDVDVSDLLGRPQAKLNISGISSYLTGKRVLVTGAGGSIGKELTKLIASVKPESLILLGRGENSIFEVLNEIRYHYPELNCYYSITNIIDHKELENVFDKYQPQVVFHAAAHKHVHFMENHVKEAFKNNVLGSLNLMKLSWKYQVERFVLISTDKAVRPKNIMGLTKRITELLMSHYALKSNTVFCAVRFGNVLGSRGSVLPLFRKQIERGGPLTVTHKDVVRYFMTIPEASQLVLQAGAMAKGNEIFILNMGEPIRIYDLAKLLIQLYRPNPNKNVDIKIIGLRPGEKLEEELWTPNEEAQSSENKDIFIVYPGVFNNDITSIVKNIEEKLDLLSEKELRKTLYQIVEQGSIEDWEMKADNQEKIINKSM